MYPSTPTTLPGEPHRLYIAKTTSCISNLPTEIIYMMFSQLDPIDSTCFGLAAKCFYSIFRYLYRFVPLSCHRVGPNSLEWAWRMVNCALYTHEIDAKQTSETQRIPFRRVCLATMFCHHCGSHRCELHRHLQTWMISGGQRREYFCFADRFRKPAR